MANNSNFDNWNLLKKKLNQISLPPFFNEREIWWCSIGINIGCEILGEGKTFSRPVLVLKKLGINNFIAVPLTTKIRFGYHKFHFKEKEVCAILGEIRKMDSKRLTKKMGKLSDNKFAEIKSELKKLIADPL